MLKYRKVILWIITVSCFIIASGNFAIAIQYVGSWQGVLGLLMGIAYSFFLMVFGTSLIDVYHHE